MRILSLGAGVQSSTLALMIKHGEIEPVDAAIFADTGDEPAAVYDYLEYLKPLLPMPLHVVSKGRLSADFLAALDDPKVRCGQPPFMVFNHQKQLGGRLWRQCTKEYKLDPIRRKTRELRGKEHVEQIIGISLDEAMRMKPSGVKYITNVYPLVDLRMTRQHCLKWMADKGYPLPVKSACTFCPYHNDGLWRDMKINDQPSWQQAVEVDRMIRGGVRGTSQKLYLHRSLKPLEEVDFRNAEDFGQIDAFGNECEGMCGV